MIQPGIRGMMFGSGREAPLALFYLKDATAAFSSFTHDSETVKF